MAINDSFWNNEQNRMLAILRPRLEAMSVEAAKQAAQKAGIAFNPNLANANAARWARDYTDNLLKQLGTTTTTGVGEMIAKWVETPGATYSQLQQSLIHYGEIRAQLISTTEVTRAYAAGERMAYVNEGITHWVWRTNRDELVCKYCGPINGKIVKIGDTFGIFRGESITQPPFHPQCRCWCSPIVMPNIERDAVIKPVGAVNPAMQSQNGVQVISVIPVNPLRGAEIRQQLHSLDISVLQQKLKATEQDIDNLLNKIIDMDYYDPARETIVKQRHSLIDSKKNIEMEILTERRKVLHVSNPAIIKVTYKDKNASLETSKRWRNSVAEFSNLVDNTLIKTSVTIKLARTNRSYYVNGIVNLNKYAGVNTGIHELGHSLEDSNPYVFQKVVEFYKRRTAGENTEKLSVITGNKAYKPYEVARKDNFLSPYMGKEYLDGNGNIQATEILSMGMEYMWKDPVDFATKDPDYFDFVLDVLRGQA